AVGGHHGGPRVPQRVRDGRTDALCRARHERDLPRELLLLHVSSSSAPVGARVSASVGESVRRTPPTLPGRATTGLLTWTHPGAGHAKSPDGEPSGDFGIRLANAVLRRRGSTGSRPPRPS